MQLGNRATEDRREQCDARFFSVMERRGMEASRDTMDISQQLAGISWIGPANKIIVSWG
jgi:hypothetical protein